MPLTWFAHQLPVLGLKAARPRWLDGTALCIGSMTPDLMYAFSRLADIDTHRWPSAMRYGVPMAIAITLVVRHVVAWPTAAQLPDLGELRLRSYAVIGRRRVHPLATLVCAVVGVASHVFLDSFTHPGRDGVRWVGYDDVRVELLGVDRPLARWFQFGGHVVGTLGCVALLWWIGRRRRLEAWYGDDAVAAARAWRPTTRERATFWACVVVAGLIGAVWGVAGGTMEATQRPALLLLAGAVVGSLVVRRPDRPLRDRVGAVSR